MNITAERNYWDSVSRGFNPDSVIIANKNFNKNTISKNHTKFK